MYHFNINEVKKKTKKFFAIEIQRLFLKNLFYNQQNNIPYHYSHFLFFLLQYEKYKKNSKTRLQNFCLITGYKRGVSRYFRFSRMKIRELALNGLILGIKKASW